MRFGEIKEFYLIMGWQEERLIGHPYCPFNKFALYIIASILI
jgi:hypothetical protein